MKIRVLGCSGGIGGPTHQTTALLVDHDILIDAGTGVCQLSLEEMIAIDHVFLTHAHVDHIAALPLLVDTVGAQRTAPLFVHALPAVIDSLRQHIFNWAIWPDFSTVPQADSPYMVFRPLAIGQTIGVSGRQITAMPVDHTVPAVAYQLDSGSASLVFSGDTGPCEAFWQAINAVGNLRHLIMECAFPDRLRDLALLSKHFCPSLLADELRKFNHANCQIHITHLKPSDAEVTMQEIVSQLRELAPLRLGLGQVLEL